jgi:hypothetical protein
MNDIDMEYDRIVDNCMEELFGRVDQLVKDIGDLYYYQNRSKEKLIQDIITALVQGKYKIKVNDLSDKYQNIEVVKNG